MNPLMFALKLYTFRSEIKILLITFFIVIFVLPILAVTILTQVGIQAASDVLIKAIPGASAVKALFDNKTIEGPFYRPVEGVISLDFGQPEPTQFSELLKLPHPGVDIAGKRGDPIAPFLKGKVTKTEISSSGYGNHIVLDHGNGLTSVYGHLSKIKVVEGQDVTEATILGTRGSTGYSTGPHLHLEIRYLGIPVNPNEFLKDL